MELATLVQLDRCHRRHDEVMEQLLAASRRLAAGRPDTDDVAAVRDAVVYFERAVCRHFLDEEGSVFPRLSTRRPELSDTLAQLSAEHPPQIVLQNAIAEAARELADDSRPGAGKQLLELTERLAALHRAHATREDAIFATAHDALTTVDDTEIAAEMATRRDRDDDASSSRRRRNAPTVTLKPVSTKRAAKQKPVKRAAKTAKKPAAKAKAKAKPKPKAKAKATAKPKAKAKKRR